jgi:hypothetical protein
LAVSYKTLLGLVVHAYNPGAGEAEAGNYLFGLHSEFKTSPNPPPVKNKSKNLRMLFPFSPAVGHLGVFLKKLKATYTELFMAVSFIIAQTWKQLSTVCCLSVARAGRILWHVQTMGYYSVLKKRSYQAMRRYQET